MRKRMCVALFAVAALAAPAWAQPDTPSPAPIETGPANFVSLDRTDDRSLIGVSTGVTVFDDSADMSPSLRFDLHGRYRVSREFGLYATIPLAIADPPSGPATALGNLDLGGTYIIADGRFPIFIRAGLVLPTAPEASSFAQGAIVPGRYSDLGVYFPGTTSLRLSASAMYRNGRVFLRGDVGMDLPLKQPEVINENLSVPPAFRGNLGLGVDWGKFVGTVELVNLLIGGNLGGSPSFQHMLTISAQLRLAKLEPFLAVSIPANESLRDAVDAHVMLGLQVPLDKLSQTPDSGQ